MEKLYTISEVADKLGLSSKTLRRWEESGKFVGSRTVGGQRRYSLTDLQVLDAIKHGTINSSSDLLTIDQAAAMFGVTTATVIRWENEGKIHPLITAGATYYPRPRLLAKFAELRNIAQFEQPPSFYAAPPLGIPLVRPEPDMVAPAPLTPTSPTPSPEPARPVQTSEPSPVIPPRKTLSPLPIPRSLTSHPDYTIPLNIAVTVILLAVYHFFIASPRPVSKPASPAGGAVQGESTVRDPSLATLDSILDKTGNLKPRSITTPSLSLSPAAPPTAIPGTIYFDAGTQTLKIFKNDNWSDVTPVLTTQTGDTKIISGKDNLPKGKDQLTISHPSLTPDSQVSVTFAADYSPAKKYWVTVGTGSFTIHTDFPVSQGSSFTYFILNPAK